MGTLFFVPISMAIQMDNLFLDSEERALVLSKFTAENQLAFAVMLKFFQNEGRYPTQADVLPEIVAELAVQLSLSKTSIAHFNWTGPTAKRFRQEIRALSNTRTYKG